MDYHKRISFFEHPIFFLKDKFRTGMNSPGIYFWGALPSLFVTIGLVSDLISIFHIGATALNILILIFLFVYGLINLFLVFALQRNIIRLNRTRDTFGIIHNSIIKKFREYISEWDANPKMLKKDKFRYIKEILSLFNEAYMKKAHRKDTVITLKYRLKGKLYPIRIGNDTENRSNEPEDLNNSFIYLAMSNSTNKIKYIYVKNLFKPDSLEAQDLGNSITNIKARAIDKYNTFIAIPIRSADLKASTEELQIKKDLGLLGFDLKEKYGFGNFDRYELDIMLCLSDILSVIVEDIINNVDEETVKANIAEVEKN